MSMNRMVDLINKIERRLGTKPLNLPADIAKDKWAEEVIIPDTLTTFSRFFPNKFRAKIDTKKKKNGFYLIDEDICESMDILGVRDINWQEFSQSSPTLQLGSGYGSFDFLANAYDVEDAMLLQMRADHTSLFNNGIYIDFQPPNMVKLTTTIGVNIMDSMPAFPLDLLVKHADNLMTISPTKMETFERLAIADVAVFLFEYLKHYDGLETVFANVDLKLSYIESKANDRAEVIQKLEESYVSASNENQPIMFTV